MWGRRSGIGELEAYKCRCSSDALPERFETGTPQIELMAGLSAAIGYFEKIGTLAGAGGSRRERIAAAYRASIAYENALAMQLIDGIRDVEGLQIRGISDAARLAARVPTVRYTVEGVGPDQLVRPLADEGIFVWSGHNYAWEIVHQIGIPAEQGVVRIGIAHYNTEAEIAETVAAVRRTIRMLRQTR